MDSGLLPMAACMSFSAHPQNSCAVRICCVRVHEQELAFEEWKVRELSRVRKEREERESAIKVGDVYPCPPLSWNGRNL